MRPAQVIGGAFELAHQISMQPSQYKFPPALQAETMSAKHAFRWSMRVKSLPLGKKSAVGNIIPSFHSPRVWGNYKNYNLLF